MREIIESELKDLEIGILNYIDNLCKKNHIKYSMAYGTLLGAVRHKGFIPWDDDIDICMDRENFEKFVKVCLRDNNIRYKLLWIDTCKSYTLPLPKVIDTTTVLSQNTQIERMKLGVYVDVFIYDKVPENEKQRKKYFKKLNIYHRLWGYSQNKYVWKDYTIKSYLRLLVYCFFHMFNPRIFVKKLNIYAQRYRNDSNYLMWGSMLTAMNREKASFPKELFDELVEMQFENNEYLATSIYDEFLKQCFGDYLKLPPIEKRISHHDFVAYFKDE